MSEMKCAVTPKGMTEYSRKGGMPMDSVSSYEFGKIFYRFSSNIDLQGKLTAYDINKEIVIAREHCKKR
jgi:hypothetical protein